MVYVCPISTIQLLPLNRETFPDNAPVLQLEKELQEGKIGKTKTEGNGREGGREGEQITGRLKNMSSYHENVKLEDVLAVSKHGKQWCNAV